MPELPEVETIRRGLAACLPGECIASVKVPRPSVLVGSARRFTAALKGLAFRAFRRHGKLLIIDLTDGLSLLVHLRMTGQLLLANGPQLPRFTRVVFELAGGRRLVYADCRALGNLELRPTADVPQNATLARMGPDALEPGAPAHLVAELDRRRAPIKCVLLDQSVIAGIGNIYASEILHAARIAPERPANTLSRDERRRLRSAVRQILRAAVNSGGTTLVDGMYCDPVGMPGGFRKHLRVYGRAGGPCLRRGCRGEVVRLVQQNRSSFACPRCQR